MSWSVQYFGEAAKVATALGRANEGLTGASKDEWEAAKPHLIALVAANFMTETGRPVPVVKLSASGNGSTVGDQPVSGSCLVSLETVWTNVV
jgi:hypothetical protein